MSEVNKDLNADALADARLAARLKSAADYDAPEGEDNRTLEQVQADLARVRLELSATVDELTGRLDPKQLSTQAKEKFASSFADTQAKAKSFADGVANGDPKSLKIAGGAVLGFIALLVIRALGK
ncbi:MAG: DUF3618 domain-containing protein [Arcanobacterium sp.]|nr:DUF3618 domain-containing protein [Arcanobacterium sp.]